MRRFARPKPVLLLVSLVALALLALLGLAGQHDRFFERAWFNLQAWWQPADARSMGLADYQVSIEARVIAGLDADVSALTYDPDRNSLFTVTNKNFELI